MSSWSSCRRRSGFFESQFAIQLTLRSSYTTDGWWCHGAYRQAGCFSLYEQGPNMDSVVQTGRGRKVHVTVFDADVGCDKLWLGTLPDAIVQSRPN